MSHSKPMLEELKTMFNSNEWEIRLEAADKIPAAKDIHPSPNTKQRDIHPHNAEFPLQINVFLRKNLYLSDFL